MKRLSLNKDTVLLDSLSIIPYSEKIILGKQILDSNYYSIVYEDAILIFDTQIKDKISNDSVFVFFRTVPINLKNHYVHKDTNLINDDVRRSNNNLYIPENNETNFFTYSQLNKSGSISRGITTGTNQDASVNSEFNLQLSGNISPDISITANITDKNIPLQSDGTSQHLREFDNVFIELRSKKSILTVGDFVSHNGDGYFIKYKKKLKGLGFETNFETGKSSKITSSLNTAVAKGKFARQTINTNEGNQGPYKLYGNNNEQYIIVLSGSEKIYMNGELLERGNDLDYVIDYNTGELTFNAKRLITKDSRIIAEFEYSELNYTGFALSSNTLFETKKSRFFLNIYSEQDAKNQSIRQDLSDKDKEILSIAGDDHNKTIVQNAIPLDTFTNNEVLYRRIDTTVNSVTYHDIFVQTSQQNVQVYRVGFSYIGENSGNYIRVKNSINGNVFEWIMPENGIPQGTHEPVKQLVSPKKKQMVNLGGISKFYNHSKLYYEAAVSNDDQNLFSNIDDNNNFGYAFKLGYELNILKADTSKKYLLIGTEANFIDKYFSVLEPYREPEFNRNWNLDGTTTGFNETFLNAHLKFNKKDLLSVSAETNMLKRGSNYMGNRSVLFFNLEKKRFSININADYLTGEDTSKTSEFIKYGFQSEYKITKLITGILNRGEKNILRIISNDSISSSSFRFNETGVYIRSNESFRRPFQIMYVFREDFLPVGERLNYASNSQDVTFSGKPINSKEQRLKIDITYRKLHIPDTFKINQKSEENLTGRIDWFLNLLNGGIQSTTFLEHLTGNEPIRDYTYIEVLPSQGFFTWKDFNENNIKEANEFVKANFSDEANYIRISLPTNEYEKVYAQKFNQSLNFVPRRIWGAGKGVKGFVSLLSNRFSYGVNRKFNHGTDYFALQISDTAILTLIETVNNDLQFDLRKTKTKLNYIRTKNASKQLLTNGIDTRLTNLHSFNIQQQIFSFVLLNIYKEGMKNFESEFFTMNNFTIDFRENKSQLKYVIDKKNYALINFIWSKKKNISGEELYLSYKAGFEYGLQTKNAGKLTISADFVNIQYEGSSNTTVSYEILEGLDPGKNYLWSVLWHKQLSSFLQIEMTYSGRKTGENKTIHTGGVNFRAIF